MDDVCCNLCGSRETTLVRSIREHRYGLQTDFRVVRCARCNLVYLNPRPSQEEMLAYYPPEYQEAMRHVVQEVRQSRVGRLGLRMLRRIRIPPPPPEGRVLDIGCASGDYLVALRRLGWQVYGIEMDAGAAEYARERFGLSIRTGCAEDTLSDFPDAHFDVVTMWHVLEHLFEPSRVLKEVRRTLKPGGILMLELPNLDSLTASLLGEYWFPLEIPRHLYHFTPQTLRAILTKTGFRLNRLTSVAAPAEIVWSLQLIWEQWTHDTQPGQLVWSPALLVLFYPACWLMAQFQRSTFMGAVAVKPA